MQFDACWLHRPRPARSALVAGKWPRRRNNLPRPRYGAAGVASLV
jgi:hypothetical protein